MKFRSTKLFAALLIGGLSVLALAPAQAISMKECSAKYKEAQAAGTLGGVKWNEFRKTNCGPAATTEAAAPAAPAPVEAGKPVTAAPAAPAAAAGAPASAVFPAAVADQYASEKPGKARMKTCLDQYNANKATNANGGLKWIQKGGGYFSECSKRLKGG